MDDKEAIPLSSWIVAAIVANAALVAAVIALALRIGGRAVPIPVNHPRIEPAVELPSRSQRRLSNTPGRPHSAPSR